MICILHMMIFDIMSGFTHSISVWIDFMAYSTMGFCQCLILIFSAGLDLGMLLMYYISSDSYKATINSHWFSQICFWVIVAFFSAKLLISCFTYAVWKAEFRREHNHTDCCRPVARPAADGS